ncbi:MAG TPA: DUF1353 domain-containing protein [Pyrinomonadaceae bacterium]|nr:DUF1353 domain-containing protein [Pyrinomonadaceae bacterium]
MNSVVEQLRSSVAEIDEKVLSGEDVHINMYRGEDLPTAFKTTVDTPMLREVREEEALTADADAHKNVFDIDVDKLGDISDEEIVEIVNAAGLVSQAGAAGDDVPTAKITYVVSRKEWMVVEDCSYRFGKWTLTAPKDSFTDLASVPRFLWPMVSSFELSIEAPLFHDLLYRCGGDLPAGQMEPLEDPKHMFLRKDADDLFYELMEKRQIAKWKRDVAYRAVRMFGGHRWNKKAADFS